ncbi:hypothetical protein ZIOFF_058865 [Zingiber officinale]|uniref:Potassium channel tetramerisation-type BTB domain-containing protein n=1 Tax=Zingiber officinale TaxID=94328 RepID=A0A8J5F8J6_ZINOF|nr:hypothetical protein ZIOFF_058865 [Zingiber officinale]
MGGEEVLEKGRQPPPPYPPRWDPAEGQQQKKGNGLVAGDDSGPSLRKQNNVRQAVAECLEFGLGALDDSWNVQQPEESEYFINRNPACFARFLNLLLTRKLHIPPNMTEKLLFHEALFYGLLDKVRADGCGAFDGNCLQLASSVSGCTPGDGTTIYAGLDDG